MARAATDPADDLYALDPADFTAARNALVKQLKADGKKEEAAEVGTRKKPNAVAWALNQVARQQPDLVKAALAAGGKLRDATEAAVGGSPDALRDAIAAEQSASRAVVDAAVRHLGAKGASLGPKVANTLRAAVLDDEVADEVRRGVLTSDLEASGFGFASGFDVSVPARRAKAVPAKATPAKVAPAKTTAATKAKAKTADDEVAERRARKAREREEQAAARK